MPQAHLIYDLGTSGNRWENPWLALCVLIHALSEINLVWGQACEVVCC